MRNIFYPLFSKNRKHWSEYSCEETQYGCHKFGYGVYRITKDWQPVEFWLDYESAFTEEIKRYEQYLKENNWRK